MNFTSGVHFFLPARVLNDFFYRQNQYNMGLSLLVPDYARVFSGKMTLVEIK